MKYLIFVTIVLAMFACDYSGSNSEPSISAEEDSVLVKLKPNYSSFKHYTIITIDGCEYIAHKDNHNNVSIEHKGNCKNPIHYQVKHDTLYVVKETGVVLQKQIKK
jgi:hypothetical protein